MKKPVYYVLIAALLLVFGISSFMVVRYFVKGDQEADSYDQLAQLASGEATEPSTQPSTAPSTEPSTEPDTQPTEETEPTEPTMISGYADIYALNQDTVGWIRIPSCIPRTAPTII